MKDDKTDVVRAWFKKAENDLLAAEYLMTMEHPPCDTVCFHSQQCAEKYLKGLLTYHGIYFPKTHSIEYLVSLCEEVTPSVSAQLENVEILSSYGVEVRYPDEIYYDIPQEDAREAIDLAMRVKSFVLTVIGW